MSFWCRRVDKIVALDREVHSINSWRSEKNLQYRGFTYLEYEALFNTNIKPNEFVYYPVFQQLARKKGGINYEKQRTYFTSHYQLNKHEYVRILTEQGFDSLLNFFFGKLSKLNAYLPLKKLFMHTAIIAPSGSGKTVLMESMFFRMTKKYKKYSFILIDPHGDISRRAKNHRHLKDRCIYIDAFLKDTHTPTFNPFHVKDKSARNINNVAEQVILAFEESLTREGGKPSEIMTYMLEKCVYFLLSRKQSTVVDLVNLLSANETIFEEAAEFDDFFDDEFLKPNNRTRNGLLGRIGRLLNSPILKNLIGGESTFDLEAAINRNKVVIFNLGGLGEMTQITFGKFIIANIKSIIRKRGKPSKKHTFCFIDEAHNFVGSFEFILAQLRGFGLHMVLANQFVEQYGQQSNSVKYNTAIKILGGNDENLEDLKKITKLPKDTILKDYEFLLKVTGRTLFKMKSPSFLLKQKKKHYLSKKEESLLDEKMLENYYKLIGDETPYSPTLRKDKDTPIRKDSPIPDLNLFINDND